jgi:trimethylamine--corrinoid protein Co-methyltransferase
VYERLNRKQIEQIHNASMQLLGDPGLLSFNRQAAEIFGAAGADVREISENGSTHWLVRVPEQLVMEKLRVVPKTVKLGARREDNCLIMKGDEPRVFLVTGSETNTWLDVGFASYVKKGSPDVEVQVPEFHPHRGTVLDLCRAAHLAEHLETLDAFIRPVNIQDKDITESNKDVNKYFASLNNTTKHVMAGLTSLEQLDNVLKMAEMVVGGKEQFRQKPIISFITCLVKSPLQFVADTTQTTIELARRGVPNVISVAPQGGTTAPIREDGIVAQMNAEVLAGITLTQLVNQGTPVLYGSVPIRARMDTLHDAYGAPESTQYNIDCVQMARFYEIPCYSTSGVSDVKIPGIQATVERLFSDLLIMLSGPQYLHCAYGLLDKNSTFCPVQAVLDDAHFKMINFFLRKPKVNEEELGESLKQIREVMATSQKIYIRYIRRLLRSGELSWPYPFEAEDSEDKVLALASKKLEEYMAMPVEHIDPAVRRRIMEEIPGVLPRVSTYEGGKANV